MEVKRIRNHKRISDLGRRQRVFRVLNTSIKYSSNLRERRIRRSGDRGRDNIRRKGYMSTGRMWNPRR